MKKNYGMQQKTCKQKPQNVNQSVNNVKIIIV